MSRDRYREALADVAAGGPAPSGLEAHLGSCPGCREELEALRRALALADEEMAGLLSAEPSPELVARVRRAVSRSEAVARRGLGWLLPAMAAALALLLALGVWLARAPSRDARVAVAVIPRDSVSPSPEGSAVSPALSRESRPRPPRAPRGEAPPVVLVPRGEEEALLRLVALVHRERVAPSGLVAADQPSSEPADPALLDIKPLEIVPLDPAEASGT